MRRGQLNVVLLDALAKSHEFEVGQHRGQVVQVGDGHFIVDRRRRKLTLSQSVMRAHIVHVLKRFAEYVGVDGVVTVPLAFCKQFLFVVLGERVHVH